VRPWGNLKAIITLSKQATVMGEKNLLLCWPRLTEEGRNEICDAMRKYGPLPSKDYDDLPVILLSNREDVIAAVLEVHRVYGTAAALETASKLKRMCQQSKSSNH